MVKASVCNAGDLGLIPWSGRSLEKEIAMDSSVLAWRISRTEKPGRLYSSWGEELNMTETTKEPLDESERGE